MPKSTLNKTVQLRLARETHGTYVYQEDETLSTKQTFPTIYVKKHLFIGQEVPKVINVTIQPGEEG